MLQYSKGAPSKSGRSNKLAILTDAVRVMKQLRKENHALKTETQNLKMRLSAMEGGGLNLKLSPHLSPPEPIRVPAQESLEVATRFLLSDSFKLFIVLNYIYIYIFIRVLNVRCRSDHGFKATFGCAIGALNML